MDVNGQRVLIVGDSLSHVGNAAAPAIAEVTQGSNRKSAAPGDLLASHLLEAGAAAVRINATIGRSAISYLTNEPTAQLVESDRAWGPTRVVIMLGTNDSLRDIGRTQLAMVQIRDTYRNMGAEVWAVGPMAYVGNGTRLDAGAANVFEVMEKVFGKQLVDARPLSVIENRAGDGIHFTATSAAPTATNLATALLTASPKKMGTMIAAGIGFATVVVLGVVVMARRR